MFSVKIAGPSTMLYIKKSSGSPSIGAEVAVQILYNISLGPLLVGTLSFVNNSISDGKNPHNASSGRRKSVCQKSSSRHLQLAHLLIIAGLVLGIVGGINRSPKSSTGQINPSEYDRGAKYLKVAPFLFLVALLVICWGLFFCWKQRSAMGKRVRYAMVAAGISLPLIFIRLVYTFLSSFNLETTTSTGRSTAFDILTGSWIAYLFLVLLPQLAVVGVYNTAGYLGLEGKGFIAVRTGEGKAIP
jgi:hypothetical protein